MYLFREREFEYNFFETGLKGKIDFFKMRALHKWHNDGHCNSDYPTDNYDSTKEAYIYQWGCLVVLVTKPCIQTPTPVQCQTISIFRLLEGQFHSSRNGVLSKLNMIYNVVIMYVCVYLFTHILVTVVTTVSKLMSGSRG